NKWLEEHGADPFEAPTHHVRNDDWPHMVNGDVIYLLFYEYFHGDNGAGLGASHQTGWTGLVAGLLRLFGTIRADAILESGLHARRGHGHVVQEQTDETTTASREPRRG